MYDFLTWLEKERGEAVTSIFIAVTLLCGVVGSVILLNWLTHLTGGWIILAVLIAPAWVAWMLYCYITLERDQ